MVGPGNAFIDSPTISRNHAVLTATPPPAACVYITDKGSMHGTMVNGNRLDPGKPHRLNNGDALQLGANVTRESRTFPALAVPSCPADNRPVSYTARNFTFESSLPSFPNGITVPDGSDDEDIEVDEQLSCPPTYGTHLNPLTIDVDHVGDGHLVETDKADSLAANASNDQRSDSDTPLQHTSKSPAPSA